MRNLFDLPDENVFEITPLESMDDLLIPKTQLCVFYEPIWNENGAWYGFPSMVDRVIGISKSGEKEMLYVTRSIVGDLGWHKSQLDKRLLSAYLFISWRKRWGHTFKMFQQHELIAEFPDFDSAIAAYMPDGFTPRNYYRYTTSRYRYKMRRRVESLSI